MKKGERQQVRILREAKHKWRTISNLICPDANKVTVLEDQFQDLEARLQHLLVESFIHKKPNNYEHNWNGMIELLYDVELETLAKKVDEALKLRTTTN